MTRGPRVPSMLAVFALAGGCAAPSIRLLPPDTPVARPQPPASESFRVVVIGDTQQMAPFDWFVRGGPKERAHVRARIEALKPDLVIHAGDVVGNGSSKSDWAEFRREFAAIPIWPVLGNHDLFGSNGPALASYFEAFPHVGGKRWYALRHPPLAFLMLDSNLGEMTDDEAREQEAWLARELDRAQADPAIRGIVLVSHHPPISSQVGGGSRRVKEAFFDAAAKRSKFLAFLSGHHHAYQHIEVGGRHAFVTGGGGAPLLLWKCSKLPEGARLVRARQAHHVLELRVGPAGLETAMHELSPNPGEWKVEEESFIAWPE